MADGNRVSSERVEFTGSRGEPLAARLDLPDTEPQAYALFAHCFTCGKDTVAASRVSRGLARHGMGVLRLDFTGLGESGGDFGNTDFTSNIDDLVRAAGYLRERYGTSVVLVGHSLGGAAALAAARQVPEVRAVVTIAAPADPAHVAHLLADSRAEIERTGAARVRLGGRTFRVRRQFLDDIAAQPQTERIARLGVPVLVLHSPVDDLVGIDNARLVFDAARHPKSFVSLDGADHLLTRPRDAEFVADLLSAWCARYVGNPNRPSTDRDRAGAGRRP